DAITINGKRIEASYEVEWNETYTKVTCEGLLVGGQSKDLAAGRIFLVDLTGRAPVYIQKDVRSMPSVTPLQSPADVQRFAEDILKTLEKQDSETKNFIR